jgi:8-oxo-dGTP diphosphatase
MELQVTAAVIIKEDAVFIAKKGPHGRFAHLWEFPGGKIEAGEAPECCVVRELMEEFHMEIKVVRFFTETTHTFPEGQIRVQAFHCSWTGGTLTPTEHEEYRWVPFQELGQYAFTPADIPIAKKLMEEK